MGGTNEQKNLPCTGREPFSGSTRGSHSGTQPALLQAADPLGPSLRNRTRQPAPTWPISPHARSRSLRHRSRLHSRVPAGRPSRRVGRRLRTSPVTFPAVGLEPWPRPRAALVTPSRRCPTWLTESLPSSMSMAILAPAFHYDQPNDNDLALLWGNGRLLVGLMDTTN